MIDEALIEVTSGSGGNGIVSGRHEKYVPHGGPDGGDGGDGGSVFVRSDRNLNTLLPFRYKMRFGANNGSDGARRLRHGRDGSDIEIRVPEGTVIWRENGEARYVADVVPGDQPVLVARGGLGGRGNSKFASSTNQFPLFAERGEPGEEVKLRLELRLLADVGIIGAPNAGKSTLLAAVTAAKPKIADYPFTTMEPGLGVAEHKDRPMVMVDIPGLIEGAHDGLGLGHDFLRHVQRTRVLVHLIDGAQDDILGAYTSIRHEIEMHDGDLALKPEVVGINKVDIPGVEEETASAVATLRRDGRRVHLVSAAARRGLGSLLDDVIGCLAAERGGGQTPVELAQDKGCPVLRPRAVDSELRVRRLGRKLVVRSDPAARIADTIDAGNWTARVQLYEQLRRMGVIAALEKAGIERGQVFRVGSLEMEWQ